MTRTVNLSALQFGRGDVEQVVARALRNTGLSLDCLELELTESIPLSHTEQVLAIVRRLKGPGLTTIAEGVEDAAVAQRLIELGCEEAQGFHFARPLPPDQFAAFMRRGKLVGAAA